MKNKLYSTLIILSAYAVLFVTIIFIAKILTYYKESKKLYHLNNIVGIDNSVKKESKWIGDYGAYYTFNGKSSIQLKICNKFNEDKKYNLNFVLSDNNNYKYKGCEEVFVKIDNQAYNISKNDMYLFEIQPSAADKCISAKFIVNSSKFQCHKWLGFVSVSNDTGSLTDRK